MPLEAAVTGGLVSDVGFCVIKLCGGTNDRGNDPASGAVGDECSYMARACLLLESEQAQEYGKSPRDPFARRSRGPQVSLSW